MHGAGFSFALLKATEGTNFTDPRFTMSPVNLPASQDQVLVGLYHFARPLDNPGSPGAVAEAQYFLNTAAPYLGAGYLPPALDLDDPSILPSGSALSSWARAWLQHVQQSVSGITPVIYAPRCVLASLESDLQAYPLWIADTSTGDPTTVPCLSNSCWPQTVCWSGWKFKQYNWFGHPSVICGGSCNVDLDSFSGDLAALQALAGRTDTARPTISVFSVPQTSANLGGGFAFHFAASDAGGSGLNRAELWRASVDGTAADGSWSQQQIRSLSGNGPINDSFAVDTPASTGDYWYGIHVVDGTGNLADERLAGLGPIHVAVFCRADFNHSGGQPNQVDVLDFLNGWLAGNQAADFNGNGHVEIQDIFDYISAWFGPC
jgi:GH25 family lysozyme M1 (1,4-beta-N-acetylmuramidase)